jgi:small-conductance mechanosensitive channel
MATASRLTTASSFAPMAARPARNGSIVRPAVPLPPRAPPPPLRRRHQPRGRCRVGPPPPAATAAAAAAAAAASKPELAAFLVDRLATVIVAPTAAALAVIALTDLLARQAESLLRRASREGLEEQLEAGGGVSSDLAPLLLLGEQQAPGEQQQQHQAHTNHHHPSALTETLALLPLALRGPTRVVLLLLVATRTLRGLLFIADEAVHTFRPSFGARADAALQHLCAQLRPLDGALLRLYSAAAVLFLTWVAIRLKTLLVARYLRRREAQAAAALAAARKRAEEAAAEAAAAAQQDGATTKRPSSSSRSPSPPPLPQPTAPPPVDLVRLLLPLDEALSWLMAASAALFVAGHQLGINLSALIAVGGAGSLVVALGTQQLVSNAVSGLNLLLSAPFVVGESVTLVGGGAPGGGISGVVEQVSVVRSRFRTEDDVLVEVPNAALAGMIVYNRSRTDARTRAPTDRLVLRVPLRVRVSLPAAGAGSSSSSSSSSYQRCASALREVLEGPMARGLVEPHSASVDVLRLSGDGGGLELLAQAMLLRDKRAEERRSGGGGGSSSGGSTSSNLLAGRARVAELLSALAAVAQREGGKIVQA